MTMPSDGERYIPKPIALVSEHLIEILQHYTKSRSTKAPFDALMDAVELTLTIPKDSLGDVMAFLSGAADEDYGAGAGADFRDFLLRLCEEHVTNLALTTGRPQLGHISRVLGPTMWSLDHMALVEAVATNFRITWPYMNARWSQDEATVRMLLREGADILMKSSARAATPSSRDSMMNRARGRLGILSSRTNLQDADSQAEAIWCHDLLLVLPEV